jgi:hypothetical protein
MMLLRAVPVHESPHIAEMVRETKATFMNWHKACLLQAYGEKIKPFVWDLVIMLQGTEREYLSLAAHEHKNIDFHETAEFIVDRLDTIVNSNPPPKPVLTAEMMRNYDRFEKDFQPKPKEKQIRELLDFIKKKIAAAAGSNNDEYLQTAQFAGEEIAKEQPRKYLIHASLAYLAERKELEPYVTNLRQLLK